MKRTAIISVIAAAVLVSLLAYRGNKQAARSSDSVIVAQSNQVASNATNVLRFENLHIRPIVH
ncbi:hypothetical protein KGP36_00580 [Patescibacteria group bacterium]|nr:hypothetical protein [Patescibacteria group bacterium]